MATYDDAIRKRIQRKWAEHKDAVKTNQAKAARAMGMNQSAFGQYLRGDIPLNTEFIQKFADLTDCSFDDLKIKAVRNVTTVKLEVRATLSGRLLHDRYQCVNSLVPADKCYLVEVDYRSHFLPKGSFIVVSETDACRAGDSVIGFTDQNTIIFGLLEDSEEGWSLIEQHFFGARSFPLEPKNKINRVVGFYLPESTGRKRE